MSRLPASLSRILAGRWGTPADFKDPLLLLASNASKYMNGIIETVDGDRMGR